jgi:hypothetical protein
MTESLPIKLMVSALLGLFVAGCQPVSSPDTKPSTPDKITFDLNQFDDDGLYGPPDGKRSLDYEFCIPQGDTYAEEVQAIDPTVNFYPMSPGRIGCTEQQTLAIGNTHQENFRLVLLELTNLDYIERIQRVDWE